LSSRVRVANEGSAVALYGADNPVRAVAAMGGNCTNVVKPLKSQNSPQLSHSRREINFAKLSSSYRRICHNRNSSRNLRDRRNDPTDHPTDDPISVRRINLLSDGYFLCFQRRRHTPPLPSESESGRVPGPFPLLERAGIGKRADRNDSLSDMLTRPERNEYSDFHADYVARVPDGNVIEILEKQLKELQAFLRTLSEEQAEKAPAPGKWSVKQVIGHLCDGERVLAYRAMRIARGDQTPLAGYEQDDYVRESNASQRALADLVAEHEAVRRSTIALFKGFPPQAWLRRGTANNAELSVRALAYITAGHEQRHLELMKNQLSVASR